MNRSPVRVWAALEAQGRMVKWLARQTGIPSRRLYGLKRSAIEYWRSEEVAAVARALGLPEDYLFPPGTPILPHGRRRADLVDERGVA